MTRTAPFRDAAHVLGSITRTHRRVGIVPSGDESLRYVLPVPRGWGRATGLGASAGPGRPEILGVFAPQPDLRGPRIIVSATRLRWDVDPLLWVRHHWERAGWSIAVARPLDARWHPRFEVGALRRQEGQVEVRRAVGLVDNGRLLRVDAVAPSSGWSEHHDLLWPCGVLFSLVKPTYRREVEARQTIGASVVVAFDLPASWRARSVRVPSACGERWVCAPDDEVGRSAALRVDACKEAGRRVETVPVRQQRLRHELWAHGIELPGRFERIHAGLAAGCTGLAGVYRTTGRSVGHVRGRTTGRTHGVDEHQRFEVRMAHRHVGGTMVDYAMLVASPAEQPIDFMRASRALEIAVSTTQVRPLEEADHAA